MRLVGRRRNKNDATLQVAADGVLRGPAARGLIADRVGDETKIDNLVQIGHNVLIGRASLICAHAALGGSSELGERCVMGGKSAIADHVRVCSDVRLAAYTGVTKHIDAPGDYAGFPAQPAHRWRRQIATASRAQNGRPGPRPATVSGDTLKT